MMLAGNSAICIFMYSNWSSDISRYMYMFLMLALAKRVPLVLMTLFHRILDETMSSMCVVSSNG